jgi:hypothetical protein
MPSGRNTFCGAFGNDANEIAGLFERALRNPSNHNPGATITKRVSRESDKRLERLERSAAMERLERSSSDNCLLPAA